MANYTYALVGTSMAGPWVDTHRLMEPALIVTGEDVGVVTVICMHDTADSTAPEITKHYFHGVGKHQLPRASWMRVLQCGAAKFINCKITSAQRINAVASV